MYSSQEKANMHIFPQNYMVMVKCLTYNHCSYIEDTMNGFCFQKTFFPYVCTIIDDCSTDGEQSIIRKYLEKNFDLKESISQEETKDFISLLVRHRVNKNCFFFVVFLKYNHYRIKKKKQIYIDSIQKQVKYIAFCEGDDYWVDKEKLQKQISYLETHPCYSLSHSNFFVYEEFSHHLFTTDTVEKKVAQMHEKFTPIDVFEGYRIRTLTVVVRKSCYEKAKLIDPFLFSGDFPMGDSQLWYLLAKMGKIHFLRDRTSVRRIVPNSATQKKNIKQNLRFSLSCAEMYMYIASKDFIPPKYYEKLKVSYSNALFRYMLFDNKFKPLFPLDLSLVDKNLLRLSKFHLAKLKILLS